MSVTVDVQSTCDSKIVPHPGELQRWVATAVGERRRDAEVSIRIVGEAEGAELNRAWRGRSGATNVLSFPAEFPPELSLPLLGDLVICAPVIEREAAEQGKALTAHWAHIVVHGTLHLLGYDHVEERDALEMEALERELLGALDVSDPYI